MKKALVLGLALVIVFALVLAACGGDEETATTAAPTETTAAPDTTATTSAPTETTAAPDTTATTSAPTETTAAPDTTEAASTQEPVTFKMAHTYIETETGGLIAQHFADYVEEKTSGAVTIEMYPGGTLGAPPEMLDLIASGSVDIVPLGHPPFADKLPLLNFPMWAPESEQNAVDYFNTLAFDDPTTAPLIQAEAEALGIKYLGFNAGGSNVFVSKNAFETLADLEGVKFGAGGMIPAFEALGVEIVNMFPPDGYENLSRGVVDATQMGFPPTVMLKWYEVAPYYMFDGTYAAGNPWTVNLDSWALLTPETQQIFMDAAKDTEAYSLTLDAEDTAKLTEQIVGEGVTVGELSAEDQAYWYDLLFNAGAADCMARAETLGIVDEMVTVLTKAAEFTGVEWSYAN